MLKEREQADLDAVHRVIKEATDHVTAQQSDDAGRVLDILASALAMSLGTFERFQPGFFAELLPNLIYKLSVGVHMAATSKEHLDS